MSNAIDYNNVSPIRPHLEVVERRVADTDDGYTRIANELLEAIAGADLTARQLKVMIAVIRKTYGYQKKLDRIADIQIADITGLSRQNVNKAKKELLSMNCLMMDGSKIGPNKDLSEWQFNKCLQKGNFVSKLKTKSVSKLETVKVSKVETHKRNTLKIKDKIPLIPQGEGIEEILNQAKQALEYYNEISKSTCRDAKPYLTLLTATTSRSAYNLQDLNLVTRWALTVWKRRGNSCPKPKSLCAVTRFDGYLSDAEKWLQSSVDIDCQAVIDAYNEVTAGKLPEADLDRDREIAIRELAQHLAKKNVEGFRAYFAGFIEDARDFYFGGSDGIGWKASFEYLMKPETLRKVRRGEL